MSSKLILLIFISNLLCSCGVKSDPVHPDDTGLPSIIDEYIKAKDDEDPKKKKTTIQSNK